MTFDPSVFLTQEVTQPMETVYTPFPAGNYSAYVDDLVWRQANDQTVLDLLWVIPDDELRAMMEQDKIVVKQSLWIDHDESGNLHFGKNKNVQLGKVREALGQNGPEPWNFGMLKGAGPAMLSITVDPDKRDPEKKYNNVQKVARM